MYHDIRHSSFGHRQFIARVLSTSLIMFAITAIAQAAAPVITSASANTPTNTLTITGTGLSGDPSSGLSSVTFANIVLTVLTQTPTSITASFPPAAPASSLEPGIYPLTVLSTGSRISASFGATVGPHTRLLFSWVIAEAGLDTGIVISNISLDPTIGSPATPGVCTLNFFGDNVDANGPVPSAVSTFPIRGSAQESGKVCYSCGFPKGDEFRPGSCQALCLQQEVAQVLVSASPPQEGLDVSIDGFHDAQRDFHPAIVQDAVQVVQ